MPLGPYKDFDACVSAQVRKGESNEAAKRICGAMQAKLEGGAGNFDSYEIKDGELYLKYFLADDSIARKQRNPDGSWAGVETPYDFNIATDVLHTRDDELIGLPFPVLPTRDLSIFGDYHPWSPKPNATWEDHIAFAEHYAPGKIVAVTQNSNLVSGAIEDIKKHNGKFAVVHIHNKEARDAYIKNPELIPLAVSPGIMNADAPNTKDIRNFRWAHLAAVPMGAFGEKATLYGSCIGNQGCINQLVAGAVMNLHERVTYCPVGASMMLTSLLSNNENNHKMEPNANTQKPEDPNKPKAIPPAAPTTGGQPVKTPEAKPTGVLRLKNALNKQNPTDPNSQQPTLPQGNVNAGQPQANDANTELEAVKQQVETMRVEQEQNKRREEIKKVIPKELFILKGKFAEKEFAAEVEKRLQAGWDDATIQEFYSNKLELLKYGISMPKGNEQGQNPNPNDPNAQLNMPQGPMPTGGSAYTSPSYATDLIGGAADVQKFTDANVRQLLGRFVRSES